MNKKQLSILSKDLINTAERLGFDDELIQKLKNLFKEHLKPKNKLNLSPGESYSEDIINSNKDWVCEQHWYIDDYGTQQQGTPRWIKRKGSKYEKKKTK